VAALVERIARDHRRLDILINDIWGGDELTEWGQPLWQLDLDKGLRMLERAVHTHIVTSRHALPLMLAGGPGLIVEVTDGVAMHYRDNACYDLAKTSVIRLTFVLAEELRDRPITVVAVSPAFLRSEAMLDHFGVREGGPCCRPRRPRASPRCPRPAGQCNGDPRGQLGQPLGQLSPCGPWRRFHQMVQADRQLDHPLDGATVVSGQRQPSYSQCSCASRTDRG
jgi:NAD(P)-dependent dehydrogenase (short-subunit alcohol dehydrogenase family)